MRERERNEIWKKLSELELNHNLNQQSTGQLTYESSGGGGGGASSNGNNEGSSSHEGASSMLA